MGIVVKKHYMINEIPNGVINPFSEAFLGTWSLWKLYKEESFKFKYKGVISEQMALKQLVELSDGIEEKAVKIIEQSIRRQWQGFFPLKETTHGTRQKSNSDVKDDLRSRVQAAFNKRYGSGGQEGDEPHLKAV